MQRILDRIPAPKIHAPSAPLEIGVLNASALTPSYRQTLLESCTWGRFELLESCTDIDLLKRFDALLLIDDKSANDAGSPVVPALPQRQIEFLTAHRLCCVILTSRPALFEKFDAGIVCLSVNERTDVVYGAFQGLLKAASLVRQIDARLNNVQRLGRSLESHFAATNRELQLAARVQRDFLPKKLPDSGPVRVATLFRPCSWVSGDILDFFRLDETHWGFYLADAVGHGVAAGLLTMYLKQTLETKRIHLNGYELITPGEVLANLNEKLVAQGLVETQFVSMFYGLYDTVSRELCYAVAGHPPPLLVHQDGRLEELHGEGALLGLQRMHRFSDELVELEPGSRLLVYSDGLESILIDRRPPMPQMPVFHADILPLFSRPAKEVVTELNGRLDSAPGGLVHADDASLLVIDFAE